MKSNKFSIFNFLRLSISALLIFTFASTMTAQKSKNMPVKATASSVGTVFQASKSPLVSLRIQFLVGSIDDPNSKAGLASLTAAMIANGGTKTQTYEQIVEQFYPMATSFGWQSDKEMTTFVGQSHIDNLPKYYAIVRQMLLDPGFREDDFKRLKDDALNFLKTSLREGNDEELGKERLYNIISLRTSFDGNDFVARKNNFAGRKGFLPPKLYTGKSRSRTFGRIRHKIFQNFACRFWQIAARREKNA
jgi:Insulinase (Peptidase family M16)